MRFRRVLALACVSTFAFVSCESSTTRGVTLAQLPGPQSVVTVRSATTGTVRWTARVPGRCGRVNAAGPRYLVINEQVLDRRSGRLLWRGKGSAVVRGASMGTEGDPAGVPDGSTLIVKRSNGVQGVDPRTGRVQWQHHSGGPDTSLLTVGPTAVVVMYSPLPGAGTVAATAWDRVTGRKKWSARIPNGSVSVTRRTVVVWGDGALRGFDIGTGRARWAVTASTDAGVGVDSGIAVVKRPEGIAAFDDATGSRLWDAAGVDYFRVQPGSGVVAASRINDPIVRLLDLRTGVIRARLDVPNSEVFALSRRWLVRAGLAVYQGMRADGHVVWSIPKLTGFEGEGGYLVNGDLVTIPDHCQR